MTPEQAKKAWNFIVKCDRCSYCRVHKEEYAEIVKLLWELAGHPMKDNTK